MRPRSSRAAPFRCGGCGDGYGSVSSGVRQGRDCSRSEGLVRQSAEIRDSMRTIDGLQDLPSPPVTTHARDVIPDIVPGIATPPRTVVAYVLGRGSLPSGEHAQRSRDWQADPDAVVYAAAREGAA